MFSTFRSFASPHAAVYYVSSLLSFLLAACATVSAGPAPYAIGQAGGPVTVGAGDIFGLANGMPI